MERYNLMQEFLDNIKTFAQSNKETQVTKKFIYSSLILFNIDNSLMPSQDIKNFFKSWKENHENKVSIFTDNLDMDFICLGKSKLSGNEVKLYIPLDIYHILDGVDILIDYLCNNNFDYQMKVANKIRNDDVIILVQNLDDAKKIIEYVKHNKYLSEGIMNQNPFLPNIDGIGLSLDNFESYNLILSTVISNLLSNLKCSNRLNSLTVENLNKFVKNKKQSIKDLDLKDIYTLIEMVTSIDFNIESFYDFANFKLIDKYDIQNKVRITDSKFYLEEAIKITSFIHPNNTKIAIKEYLKGNPNYFTNKDNARSGLIKYVKKDDLLRLMKEKFYENGIDIPNNQELFIDKYIDLVLNKIDVLEDNRFNIIKNAYINTLNTYNLNQANEALKALIIHGEKNGFTNKYKDRDKLVQFLANYNIKKIILNNIDTVGIDLNDYDEIVNRFSEEVIEKEEIDV